MVRQRLTKRSVPLSLNIFLRKCFDHWKALRQSSLYRRWFGIAVLALATLVFFFPLLMHITDYSPGGDAMFNAWEMARNQHCILREHCTNYIDANIYFPNKGTMLYSEAQISAAVVTLPFHWLSPNPILAYNLLTIASFFASGLCMYLLAKYLSKGNEAFSIFAGLIFEFAPFKMAAIWHLQNLSIFCLPLAVLLVLKFLETKNRKLLWMLLATLLYVNFASWVQMVFVLGAMIVLCVGLALWKRSYLRPATMILGVIAVSALATAPLAWQYVQFAKVNHAAFSILDQELYNSSVADYFIPHDGTILGKVYYHLMPGAIHNAYNLDSYSYHGIVLYVVFAVVAWLIYRWRKKDAEHRRRFALFTTITAIGVIGFVVSLGPFLKIRGVYLYSIGHDIQAAIILPYALVDKFLPQLAFIRAVGRASALVLFMLCCSFALLPLVLQDTRLSARIKRAIPYVVGLCILVELMPAHLLPMNNLSYSYSLSVPKVYEYISAHREVDNIAILRGDDDYPGAPIPIARAEDVLWSGYHNRNIFNGYSGYEPPDFMHEYIDFINFTPNAIPEMQRLGLRYVLIDKLLSGAKSQKPALLSDIRGSMSKVYEDNRYALFLLP